MNGEEKIALAAVVGVVVLAFLVGATPAFIGSSTP